MCDECLELCQDTLDKEPHKMPRVRRSTPDDLPHYQAIVRSLPNYFTDDVPDKIGHGLEAHDGWAVTDGGIVVGFTIVERRSSQVAELLWMAVEDDRRHRGFGTFLLNFVLRALASEGVELIEAKTLDRSANYEPYRATRAFWEGHGFVHIDTIDPLPGWQPGNPAAIYVRSLGSTRRRRTAKRGQAQTTGEGLDPHTV
jgi:GNAT superfamily N-acetyltransferase